jgi:hypothetical protein
MPFDRAGWASQLSRKSCCSMNLLEPRIAPEFDECCVTSGASRRRSRARIVGLSGAASRQRVAVPGGRTVIGAAGHTPESPYEPQGWLGRPASAWAGSYGAPSGAPRVMIGQASPMPVRPKAGQVG